MQLEAGRSMMGTTLFYPSHPYNHAFALVNDRFIGINQLTVIAQATGEVAFRNPKALEALEAFQHHMAEDEYFGGAIAITGLAKSITRMFHEDIPKWEMIPSDIDSTGQVIFRIITAAATPNEVERFLSTDFRTTAVTFFYRDYSPAIVERILARAQAFIAAQDGSGVEFRLGGGILGILAAVHAAVEASYWRIFSVLILLTFAGALLGFGTLRAAVGVTVTCALSQGVMLALLWLGSIDFNMYTLPVVLTSLGIILIPTFLVWAQGAEPTLPAQALAASGLTVATAAAVWLFSPLRLQAEIGVLLIVLTLANALFPLRIQKSLESGSLQSGVKTEEGGSLVPN
jgi:hypothetical protein